MNILGNMYGKYKTMQIVKMKNLFEFKCRLYGEQIDMSQPTLADIFKGLFNRVTRRKIQANETVGININNPSLIEINDTLNLFASITGCLYLEQYKQKGFEPYQLTLYSQNQKYMVMFAYVSVGPDDEIRTFDDSTRPNIMVDMLGDNWSNAMIVDDFSLVRRAFTEFYLTGDIDREIVS
ncbi:hypothetical protein ABW387_18670 [Snodgrassella alvi]|uniref:DUF6911 family protein n=1 Tax=Snodgrassella alvi TaxID=1196083 RepID=UPI003511792C